MEHIAILHFQEKFMMLVGMYRLDSQKVDI